MSIIFLEIDFPGCLPQLGGFVIIDRESRRVWVRSRCTWDPSIDLVDAEVLSGTSEVIESFFENMDFEAAVAAVLGMSNVVRATNELRISAGGDFEVTAESLAALLLS